MKIYRVSCGESAEDGFNTWWFGAKSMTDALAKGEKKLKAYDGDLEITSVVLMGETE